MFFAFFLILLMLNGAIGVLAWLAWRRVAEHMRNDPAAAELVAKYVIAPLLTGEKKAKPEATPETKKIKGTLV